MPRIPKEIHPFQPRALHEHWAETVRVAAFPRVADSVLESSLDARAMLEAWIEVDALGDTHFRYRLDSTVDLQCQRCLEPVAYPIRIDGDLLIERPGRSPQRNDLEWVEVDPKGVLVPMDVLEEEFLLALPLAPRHTDCQLPRAVAVDPDREMITIGQA